MAPNESSPEWQQLKDLKDFKSGKGRSPSEQAGYQLIALGVTLCFALVGGLFVGFLLKLCGFLGQPSGDRFFDDGSTWHIPPDIESGDVISKVIAELDSRKSYPNKVDVSGAPLLVGDFGQGDMALEEKSFHNDKKVEVLG